MILTKKVETKDIKDLELERLLDVNKVKDAVLSNNKNALRDLIFYVVDELRKMNIKMEEYYYGRNVVLSTEEFDMFTMNTIEELFEAFGYSCIEKIEGGIDDWELLENGYLAGKLYIIKDDVKFVTNIYNSMHDSLISMFIDTKEFEVVSC